MVIPKFSFSASSTISNPYYVMHNDPDLIYKYFQVEKIRIVKKCKISLPKYGMALIFDDNAITFCIDPDSEVDEHGNHFVEPLLTYLRFATYLNYNMVAGPKSGKDSINDLPCEDKVILNIGQITQAKTNEDVMTKIIPCVTVPAVILPYRSPLALTEIRAPLFTGFLAVAVILKSLMFRGCCSHNIRQALKRVLSKVVDRQLFNFRPCEDSGAI